jgi:hypothetical protein
MSKPALVAALCAGALAFCLMALLKPPWWAGIPIGVICGVAAWRFYD